MSSNSTEFPFQEVTRALAAAFPDTESLDMMVQFKLGVSLQQITQPGPIDWMALRVVRWAKARDRVDDLIVGALNFNPKSSLLQAAAGQLGLDEGAGDFEAMVIATVPMTDVEKWREQMMKCERAVCRVEAAKYGTGFLVGPGMVITNYHVVRAEIEGKNTPDRIVLRFDYKMNADGKTVQDGMKYPLAVGAKWLAAASPELDYALLRVTGNPEAGSVADQPGAPIHGFLTPRAYSFKKGDPLFIIQHPEASPLKFAPGTVVDVSLADKRVAYTVNTQQGSSGSPCFTSDWQVVALHHFGGKDHNRGVIFSSIIESLQEKGVAKEVGL
jgi:V8-like Glu-specific endopeptidase